MDQEKLKDLFEDKYETLIGISFQEWLNNAPRTQDEAFERCNIIDNELNATYDEWYEAEGDRKEELEEYRAKLKAEYDLLVEVFHLEDEDRSW